MPRIIKDESGTDVEVFDKSEVDELQGKVKELEQDINPNWRELRKSKETLEKELADLRQKAKEGGVKVDTPALDREEAQRIAQEAAERTYLNRYKDRVLNQFGEKRETVEKLFEKLSTGEQLSEDAIDRIVSDAARVAGVRREPNRDLNAHYGSSGSRPNFEAKVNDEGFGSTPSGKATAAAMGLIIEEPKK